MRDPRDEAEDDRPDAPAGLFFSRRGNWFHDGQRVRHERLAALLRRSVARSATGALILTTGRDVVPFVAEDAPLLVTSVAHATNGVMAHLSDGREEAFPPAVVVGDDDRWRIVVGGGAFWALLTRSAQQALEPCVVDEGRLVVGDVAYRIVAAPVGSLWSAAPRDGGEAG